ncbi:anti sigma factor C-terminal domain-containing protein [Paucisalibacillus sp. EB02]|uniref:anti sigma factor C-terminal domain-containing protein n=1 Tax=Paucisalibacillus sp. EB02 TaxID=1347087 RepID=UPI0006943554|nr:anti sigma factor C-terminal domain-containing protein [Paucisalibacillus sp. EB02]
MVVKLYQKGNSSSPYEEGDFELLHTQFIKTLLFLNEREAKANNLFFGDIRLKERSEHLKDNGIKHYGVVITGPTKEILQ